VDAQIFTDVQNLANHPNFFATTGPGVYTGTVTGYTASPYNPGTFVPSTGFAVPNSFSATRIINVGVAVTF